MMISTLERRLSHPEHSSADSGSDAVLEAYRRFRANGRRGEYGGIVVTRELVEKAVSRARRWEREKMALPRLTFL